MIITWRNPGRLAKVRQAGNSARYGYTPLGSVSGPLTAGTASLVSSGIAGIVVTAADAAGGTPAYTYQWQRNASGGSYSNLANGGGVSGATTLTVTDGSAAAGTLYGYKLVYTDAASGTVTSTAITAQVYAGGPLSGVSFGPFASALIRGA